MTSRRAPFRLLAIALPFIACGCQAVLESVSGVYKIQQSATISFNGDKTILAPDTVAARTPFEVRFTSTESKCTDLVRDEYSVRGDSVVIQSVVSRASQCGDALQLMAHLLQVQINTAGAYRIQLRGLKSSNGYDKDTVVTRGIIVR